MERLTRKYDDDSYAVEMQDCKTETEARTMLMDNFEKCCNKLGKLEDLEEEIGISLAILLKFMRLEIDVIYTISNNKIIKREFTNMLGKCIVCEEGENTIVYAFEEFNKLWFVTRDEAEQALEEMKDET